jgi:hypothetical protein
MRKTDYLHNPFQNRFHVPVTQRLDEMQAVTNMVWLHEQMVGKPNAHEDQSADEINRSEQVMIGLWSLLFFWLISVVVLLTAF